MEELQRGVKRVCDDYLFINHDNYEKWRQEADSVVKKLRLDLIEYSNAFYSKEEETLKESNQKKLEGFIEKLEGLLKVNFKTYFDELNAGCSGSGRSSDFLSTTEWLDKDSALNKLFQTAVIKNHKHIDPNTFLKNISKILFENVAKILKDFLSMNISIILKAEFVRGEKTHIFYTGTKNKK